MPDLLRRHWPYLLSGLLTLTILALILPNFIHVTDCFSGRAATIRNLHSIQLALERYAIDHSFTYPSDLLALSREGYLPVFPANPYRLKEQRKMEAQSPYAAPIAGNFVYVPKREGPLDPPAGWTGYDLFAYGQPGEKPYGRVEDFPGLAGQQVIVQLSSNIAKYPPRVSSEAAQPCQ